MYRHDCETRRKRDRLNLLFSRANATVTATYRDRDLEPCTNTAAWPAYSVLASGSPKSALWLCEASSDVALSATSLPFNSTSLRAILFPLFTDSVSLVA